MSRDDLTCSLLSHHYSQRVILVRSESFLLAASHSLSLKGGAVVRKPYLDVAFSFVLFLFLPCDVR